MAAPPPSPAAPVVGPNGLPKRVPKAHLLTGTNRAGPAGQQPVTPRDATRARGFLSSFQSGIRQIENDHKGEGSP
jgi:hypothetical protein